MTLSCIYTTSDAIERMMFNHFSFKDQHIPLEELTISVSTSRIESKPTKKRSPLSISSTKSDTTSINSQQQQQQQPPSSSSKFMAWMVPSKKSSPTDNDASSISSKSSPSKSSPSKLIVDDLSIGVGKYNMQNIDITRLYEFATKDIQLFGFTHSNCVDNKLDITPKNTASTVANSIASSVISTTSTSITIENSKPKLSDNTFIKPNEKESKPKVPTSVLPWKTKWKPSPEDKKYA